jgi:hypothetical protein
VADCSWIAGRAWPGHCCAHGSEDAAEGCTIESLARVSGRHVAASQKQKKCERIQAREAVGRSSRDASGRPALGEGEDPVNMEDANIGLGKRSGSLPRGLGY